MVYNIRPTSDKPVPLPPTRPEKTSFTGISNVYPISADIFNEEIKAAEERGRRKGWAEAIEALRDSRRYNDWIAAQPRTTRVGGSAGALHFRGLTSTYLADMAPKEES